MQHWKCALLTGLAVTMASIFVITARADEVTDWKQYMLRAALVAKTSPIPMTRNAAIVQAAVFDAVNGINPRYTPLHVKPAAPHGASRRAAAVQAAYFSLVNLYPIQISTFDAQRTASLMAILSGGGRERARSVLRGIQWVKPWPMQSGPGGAQTASIHHHHRSPAEMPSGNGVPRRLRSRLGRFHI
jgi:hypothetical protein